MANHEWSLDELRHKAEAYCASAEHCSYEVSSKLQQWGACDDEIEQILTHLTSQHYIDEERYCHAFAHDKLLYQGWGRIKIQAALYAKHLPTPLISQAIDAIDQQQYLNTLTRILTTKKRAIKSSDPMAREKLIRFCLQRGFTYDEILPLL
jgi:regulatory protein